MDRETGTLKVKVKRGKVKNAHVASAWRKYLPASWPAPVSVETIATIVEEVRLRAQVAPFAPHDLRRSFATHLFRAGKDIKIISKLMRHANIATTAGYDKRSDEEAKAAVDSLGSGDPPPESLRLCPCCRLRWQISGREVELDRREEQRRKVAWGEALRRAKRLGLPTTLTLEEWHEARLAFAGACAYCGGAEGRVIEHSTPLGRGGGTTRANCIPSCVRCNSLKKNRVIAELRGDPDFPTERLDAIEIYLAQF
jgi:5-methylcytosine-specific restriction endonuclease McrA